MDVRIFTIAIIMGILDSIYLSLVSNHFKELFMKIQGSEIKLRILPAIFCYALMVFGIYYFLVKENKPITDAFLLGVLVYGVYDLTNMATIKEWTWNTVLLDSVWGGILFTSTYYITKQIHVANYFSS